MNIPPSVGSALDIAVRELALDAERTADAICEYVVKIIREQNQHGAILGLSGGIDSAVLLAHLAKALPTAQIHAIYLPAAESDPEIGESSRCAARHFGVTLEEMNIEPLQDESGQNSSPSGSAPALSRFWHALYEKLAGEPIYLTCLRHRFTGMRPGGWRKKLYRATLKRTLGGFGNKHITRRRVLEEKAREKNFLLFGAANHTEWLTAWFVKNGVDDLYYQPIAGLYKIQVRQMAEYLGVPERIRNQKPSADMRRGLTDDITLGATYPEIDLVLDHARGGVHRDVLTQAGIGPKKIAHITAMARYAVCKHDSPHDPPPVDGGHNGGFRRA